MTAGPIRFCTGLLFAAADALRQEAGRRTLALLTEADRRALATVVLAIAAGQAAPHFDTCACDSCRTRRSSCGCPECLAGEQKAVSP